MGRVKEQPRSGLAVLQDIVAGGKALVDGAQTLGRTCSAASSTSGAASRARSSRSQRPSRSVSPRASTSSSTGSPSRFAGTWNAYGIACGRSRTASPTCRRTACGARRPLQAIATGAGERASAALARIEELGLRLQQFERRIAELSRDNARETIDADDFRSGSIAWSSGSTDLGREVGTKLGELGALKERFTRIEGRVVEGSKDQIARAGRRRRSVTA
jgi:hypothetical protein